MPLKDPEARRKYSREYKRRRRAEDPEYKKRVDEQHRKRCEKRYYKNKSKAIEYTGGEPCHNISCCQTIKYLHQVDFHHVIPENKTRDFASLFRDCSWDTVKKEIDDSKAIPLCAMCHRDTEYKGEPKPLYTQEGLD